MSRLRVGKMASNILKSFPNLGMRSKRQEGAWRSDRYTILSVNVVSGDSKGKIH